VPNELINTLTDKGLLGVLLLAAIGTIVFLYTQLTKERRQCSEDFKNIIAGNTTQLKEQQVGNDARTRALETHTRAMELMTVELNHLTNAVERIAALASEAMNSNREVVKALIKKGVDL